MKYLRFFLIVFLIPFMVLAEECDVSNITITSMKPNKIEGNTEVISDPTFEDRTINLDLKMFEVGDSITYDMTIKNESEEDYMIDENTFETDSEYIEYTLKTNDNSNVVKSQSSKNISLTVTYKKEVDDNLLNNNKFDASNNLKLSLNTNAKEKPLDTIVTDNIKKSVDPIKVTNPQTESSNIKLIVAILVLVTIIIMFTIYSKKQYIKYFIILIPLFIIPMVYAICKCDIEVNSIIEIEKIPSLKQEIIDLSKEDNSCIVKYEGDVTDEVGNTVPATNVYLNKCRDKRNVIFGGFCWQIVRTTETGGTKMIYYGEPVDGKCESTRENHKGFDSGGGTEYRIDSNYLYGSSFEYDLSSGTFTILDTFSETWSDSTADNLIGKYTCLSNSNTCTQLIYIHSYCSNTYAYITSYTIKSTDYYTVGRSPFNANYNSPAMVGYMFNKVYKVPTKVLTGIVEYKYGNSFTYDENTGMYTLDGEIQGISEWRTGYKLVNNTHYTCWNNTGTCSTISYIISSGTQTAYYLDITDGKDINDALDEMLYDNNVNVYNSNIKMIIDKWFEVNLTPYVSKLEGNVYCNNRNIDKYNSFNPNGGSTTTGDSLKYVTDEIVNDLICPNITDQFSTANPKAKLKYPIALLSRGELDLLEDYSLLYSGNGFSLLSPRFYNKNKVYTSHSFESAIGLIDNRTMGNIRPSISLNSNNVIVSGTGSEENPWIVE